MALSFLKGSLRVTVIDANLTVNVSGLLGSQDPYVKVYIGTTEAKTKTQDKVERNPVWNESFTYKIAGLEEYCTFELYDENVGKDALIGRTTVRLDRPPNPGRHALEIRRPNGQAAGTLNVEFDFTPAPDYVPPIGWVAPAKPAAQGPLQQGYQQPPQQGGYPPQQGGYPPQQGGYPPQQGYQQPPQQGGYPPQQGGYPPQQGGYPPQQGYQQPPQQGGYPPQQGGYPPQQGGYPPQQGGYPPQQGGYPPQQGGYPPQQGGYPPQQGGFVAAPQRPPGVTSNIDASTNIEIRGPYGGNGGGVFQADNSYIKWGFPTAIWGTYDNNYVYSLKFVYGSQGSFNRGGKGNQVESFPLAMGEFVTSIECIYGQFLEAVRFTTNHGKVSNWFGDANYKGNSRRSTIEANGKGLVTISGRSGSWIDQVSFIFASPR